MALLARRAGAVNAGLDAIQARVQRGSTALDPALEAGATRAPVVSGRVERLRRTTFEHLSLDAVARQRAVLEHRGDRGTGLGVGHRVGRILDSGTDEFYRLSRSPRATASPAVRTPSLASRRASRSRTA